MEIKLIMSPPEKVVPTEKMDKDLPGYAWDLLPYDKTPSRSCIESPMWHAEYDHEQKVTLCKYYRQV